MSEATTNRSCGICVELKYLLVSVLAGLGSAVIGSLIYLLSWSPISWDIFLLCGYVSLISGIFVLPIAAGFGYPLSRLLNHKSNFFWLILSLLLGAGFGLLLGLTKQLDELLSLLAIGAVYGGTYGVFMVLLRRIPQMGCKREVAYSTQEMAEPDEGGELDAD